MYVMPTERTTVTMENQMMICSFIDAKMFLKNSARCQASR
jgi:hypothetical protein